MKRGRSLSLGAWRGMLPFFAPHRGLIIASCAAMLAASVIDVLIPLYQRWLIDSFVLVGTTEGLVGAAALGACLIAAQMATTMAFTRGAIRIEMRVGRDLKDACFTHLQTLSLSYYSSVPTGQIVSRVMSDTDKIGVLIAWGLVELMWGASYIVFAVISMLALDLRLGLCAAIVMPIMAIVTRRFQGVVLRLNRVVRKLNSRVTGALSEGATGASTSKALVNEEENLRTFARTTERMRRASIRAASVSAAYLPVMMCFASVAVALLIVRGGLGAAARELDIGTLSAMITYAMNLFQPIQSVSRLLNDATSTQANIERVLELLAMEPDVRDAPEVAARYGDTLAPRRENWEPMRGDVEFDDVSFRYPGGELVLERFSLSVPAGSCVALVGETGAGKSTIVNLVCRFYDPTEGRVLIDGRDCRERSQLWLRSQIGCVLQTPHLFSGSVRENIRYGRPEASDDEIMEAARLVSADAVIARLPGGLDADVGEGGGLLSTGEKQLISFARAVIADPRIFVLDEATSSVDSETEAAIQRASSAVMRGRTSFVIAHRLSTITNADMILVIEDGGIMERGTHAELMRARGRYRAMYERMYEDAG